MPARGVVFALILAVAAVGTFAAPETGNGVDFVSVSPVIGPSGPLDPGAAQLDNQSGTLLKEAKQSQMSVAEAPAGPLIVDDAAIAAAAAAAGASMAAALASAGTAPAALAAAAAITAPLFFVAFVLF